MKYHQEKFKQHIDKKLSRRIKIYLFISLIMSGVFVYEMIVTHYGIGYGLIFFVLSVILGFFLSRMYRIWRDQDNERVTSRMDRIGIIILVFYSMFALSRHYLLAEYVPKTFILPITFAIVSGIMIGRYIGMTYKVHHVLKQQNMFQ